MKFDWFVVPFLAGFNFMLLFLAYKSTKWIVALTKDERVKLAKHVFSFSIFKSQREIFKEALLHIKIFKTNPVLGYMHMSIAFGWFMLIMIGNLQVKIFSPDPFHHAYYPIFLKFFEPNPPAFRFDKTMDFFMDFFLLFVLSGIALAWIKRQWSSLFNMNRTTVHLPGDRIALTFLWFVFPLRLFAESLSSAIYHNGHFLTATIGKFFASFLPADHLLYPAWWAYSIVLGVFFASLPFSRYMHIPAEILLIIFRNAGIKASKRINTFAQIEINACSRCGICIDKCPLSSAIKINDIQPVYYIRDIRNNTCKYETARNCLICGRCNSVCPVGIETTELRLAKRIEFNNRLTNDYSYIPEIRAIKTDILYFAGCMTHLTPSIRNSMKKIFDLSGVSWEFLDKDGSICCGRPLMLAGQMESARMLIDKNLSIIKSSGAKTLVTSCPICYKAFREEYKLDIEILHHSQFILRLIENNRIFLKKPVKTAIYHDPCELGRNSGVFSEPRTVVNYAAKLVKAGNEYENSPCCGGSLGNTNLNDTQRKQIARDALDKLGLINADMLITGCPLCKKTFNSVTEKPVIDIAQLVAENVVLIPHEEPKSVTKQHKEKAVYTLK